MRDAVSLREHERMVGEGQPQAKGRNGRCGHCGQVNTLTEERPGELCCISCGHLEYVMEPVEEGEQPDEPASLPSWERAYERVVVALATLERRMEAASKRLEAERGRLASKSGKVRRALRYLAAPDKPKTHRWTPEARAAAAERARKMHRRRKGEDANAQPGD